MRTYPSNSPQAAARIVALAMLSGGKVCTAELDTPERLDTPAQLGLQAEEFDAVVHSLCDDLISTVSPSSAEAFRVDPRTLACMMDGVADPGLRLKVLRLCTSVVDADSCVDEGESIILKAAVERWGLRSEMLQPRLAGRVAGHV